jgi:hypothetical protein
VIGGCTIFLLGNILQWAKKKCADGGSVRAGDIMDLYLHSIVAHLADTWEVVDLRSVSTERPEASFATVRRVLENKSNHNFKTIQPFDLIWMTHHDDAVSIVQQPRDETVSRIGRAWMHSFKEISLTIDDQNRTDVEALIKKLHRWGYSEAKGDWVLQGNCLTFNTLAATVKAWKRFAS